MRTTLTIDDAIAKALKDLAHRSNKPFKQVVNETLRAGLSAPAVRKSKRYKVKPAALGGVSPGINVDKALTIDDAIEDQERASTMQLRKSILVDQPVDRPRGAWQPVEVVGVGEASTGAGKVSPS